VWVLWGQARFPLTSLFTSSLVQEMITLHVAFKLSRCSDHHPDQKSLFGVFLMDPTIPVNERVDVAVLYRKQGDIATLCFPYKMKFRGQEIVFTELCLRHPTTQGRRMVHVFDMTDGVNDYRLEFDAEGLTWTLVATLEGRQ